MLRIVFLLLNNVEIFVLSLSRLGSMFDIADFLVVLILIFFVNKGPIFFISSVVLSSGRDYFERPIQT